METALHSLHQRRRRPDRRLHRARWTLRKQGAGCPARQTTAGLGGSRLRHSVPAIRDVATRGVDHLAWADELADALMVLADARERLGEDAVELVLMPGRLLDAHARRLIEGEG